MTGDPLPHCQFSVEPCYEGDGPRLHVRQPPLLRLHGLGDEGIRAFDLRNALT